MSFHRGGHNRDLAKAGIQVIHPCGVTHDVVFTATKCDRHTCEIETPLSYTPTANDILLFKMLKCRLVKK